MRPCLSACSPAWPMRYRSRMPRSMPRWSASSSAASRTRTGRLRSSSACFVPAVSCASTSTSSLAASRNARCSPSRTAAACGHGSPVDATRHAIRVPRSSAPVSRSWPVTGSASGSRAWNRGRRTSSGRRCCRGRLDQHGQACGAPRLKAPDQIGRARQPEALQRRGGQARLTALVADQDQPYVWPCQRPVPVRARRVATPLEDISRHNMRVRHETVA
jgi:hypothetical protein